VNRSRPPGIWVNNHLANPVLRPLLHGSAGYLLGRRRALIRYSGRRTGRAHELPVHHAHDGDRIWIQPDSPEHKT
jgi:hypothetical protein